MRTRSGTGKIADGGVEPWNGGVVLFDVSRALGRIWSRKIICLSQPYMKFIVLAYHFSTQITNLEMAGDDSETPSKKRSRSDDDGKLDPNASRTRLMFEQTPPRTTTTWDHSSRLLMHPRRSVASFPTKSSIFQPFPHRRATRNP